MRDQLRTMEKEHQQLMNGMSDEQSAALRNRVEQMNQARQQVNARLGQLDEQLNMDQPDPKLVREQARQIEREMNRWKSEYRSMQQEMGAKP
jgi:chromosome segregation ATPase